MTNQPRFCPHCGNELKADAKFCPKCGYALSPVATGSEPAAAPQPEPTQAAPVAEPTTTENAQSFSGNYFNWYLDTLKHPSQPRVEANRFFGIISMVVEALLLALTLTLLGQKIVNMVTKMLNTYEEAQLAKYLNLNGLVFKSGLIIFFLVIIGYAIYVSIGYAFRRLITEEYVNFWDFVNQFAGVTNLILIFNLITFLLGLITGSANFSSLSILLVFMVPANLLINAAFVFIIIDGVDQSRMDKFYTVFLAEISLTVAFFIFGFIATNIVGGSIVSYVQSLYNSVV
ncbi:zinc ribbon domain-containing protein [Levilactobacillus sp. 244-2]|uniref:zinc ribbon domain-containing protein n=1 Tax=Levilactobacillus sp. 244-2 TaxID=2799569 RepID=UPI00194F8345|nr:zinc ribbon domain-containing protein [Levilactobacillus sp. 244-2]